MTCSVPGPIVTSVRSGQIGGWLAGPGVCPGAWPGQPVPVAGLTDSTTAFGMPPERSSDIG
jgi:hypothetical protein